MDEKFYFSVNEIIFMAYFPGSFRNIYKLVMTLDSLADAEFCNAVRVQQKVPS